VTSESRAPKETDRMAWPTHQLDPGETIPFANGTTRPDPNATVPITDHTARSGRDSSPAPHQPTRSVRAGSAGILTAVLVILAIGMIVAQIISAEHHQPGPGTLAVGAHIVSAIAGVCCYRLTTRGRPIIVTVLSFLALPLITGLLLWFFWWSPT
jgi:hypothetical protein